MNEARIFNRGYGIAIQGFVSDVVDGLSAHTIVGQIRENPSRHGGPIRNVPGESPLDHPLTTVGSDLIVSVDTLRNFDVDAFVSAVALFAISMCEKRHGVFIQVISEVAEKVGNTLGKDGEALTYDDIIDLEEKTVTGFDRDGNPTPLTIIDPTGIVDQLIPTEEQLYRCHAMRAKKKEEYLAQKRHRRIYC